MAFWFILFKLISLFDLFQFLGFIDVHFLVLNSKKFKRYSFDRLVDEAYFNIKDLIYSSKKKKYLQDSREVLDLSKSFLEKTNLQRII